MQIDRCATLYLNEEGQHLYNKKLSVIRSFVKDGVKISIIFNIGGGERDFLVFGLGVFQYSLYVLRSNKMFS